jgi:MATE family multidrug resistance protein
MLNFFSSREFRQQTRKTWQLAWPVMLANLSLPLLNLADTAILGHLDSSIYLAGIAAGSSLFAFVFGGIVFLRMGLSGFISQAYGKKDIAGVLIFLKQYLIVSAALVFLLLVFHRMLITTGIGLISPPDDAATEAILYLQIRSLGIPAIVFNSVLLGFFVGLQNTKVSLYSISLTQILNIALNFIFVFGFGYKTAGIAIGTVISEYLGLFLVLWQLKRTLIRLKSNTNTPSKIRWHWPAFKPIFYVSSNLFVRSFLLLSIFVWFNRLAAEQGTLALASNAILLTFLTLISNFLDGIAAAAEAQTGHAIGRQDRRLLIQVWQVSGLMNLFFMLTLSCVFLICGESFLGLLTNQDNIKIYSSNLIPYVALLPISSGIAFWLDGIFIGSKQSKAMRDSVISSFICFIGLTQVMPLNMARLWLLFNLFFLVRSLWLLTVFYKKMP